MGNDPADHLAKYFDKSHRGRSPYDDPRLRNDRFRRNKYGDEFDGGEIEDDVDEIESQKRLNRRKSERS